VCTSCVPYLPFLRFQNSNSRVGSVYGGQVRPDSVVSLSQYESESCATQLVPDTSQLLDAIYHLTAGFLPGEWACLEVDFEIDSHYSTTTALSNVILIRIIALRPLGYFQFPHFLCLLVLRPLRNQADLR